MEPEEIQTCLQTILANVNAFIAELIQNDRISKREGEDFDQKQNEEEEKDQETAELDNFYDPVSGNVAFASAYDGWAFTLDTFYRDIAKKLDVNPRALKTFLWGRYYYNKKEQKIQKTPPRKESQEMFVQFVMAPLVEAYRKNYNNDIIGDKVKMREASKKIKEIFQKRFPVETAVLNMICQALPSPVVQQKEKITAMCSELAKAQTKPEQVTEGILAM